MSPINQIGQGVFVAQLAAAGDANAWYRLALPGGTDPATSADRLRDEMQLVLDREVVIIDGTDGPHVLAQAVHNAATHPLIAFGVDRYTEADWRNLDLLRSHLGRGRAKVLLCDTSVLGPMENWAPHFTSFIAGATWLLDSKSEMLSDEEREGRLRDLREAYQHSDVEVIAMAEAGKLPQDPDYAEWLVLLGKGQLL